MKGYLDKAGYAGGAFRLLTAPFRMPPSFMVIGAQKSATTTFYHLLIQHPQIVAGLRTETHFFDTNRFQPFALYRAQFPLRPSGHRVTGEATPDYLYHPCSAQKISRAYPNTRFFVLLRNPVDRAYSHYQHNIRLGKEDRTFEEAIAQEDDILKEIYAQLQRRPRGKVKSILRKSYKAKGRYAEQLKRWWELFDRDQFRIYLFDEFVADLAGHYRDACEWLGLERVEYIAIQPKNIGRYEPMREDTRQKLAKYFEPYNRELEEVLGRQLKWYGG